MKIRKHIRFAWSLFVGFVFLLIVFAHSGTAGIPHKGTDCADMETKNRFARPEPFVPKSHAMTLESSRGMKNKGIVGIQPDDRFQRIITKEALTSEKGSSRSLFGAQLAFNPQPEPPKDKVNPPKDKVNPSDEKSRGGLVSPSEKSKGIDPNPMVSPSKDKSDFNKPSVKGKGLTQPVAGGAKVETDTSKAASEKVKPGKEEPRVVPKETKVAPPKKKIEIKEPQKATLPVMTSPKVDISPKTQRKPMETGTGFVPAKPDTMKPRSGDTSQVKPKPYGSTTTMQPEVGPSQKPTVSEHQRAPTPPIKVGESKNYQPIVKKITVLNPSSDYEWYEGMLIKWTTNWEIDPGTCFHIDLYSGSGRTLKRAIATCKTGWEVGDCKKKEENKFIYWWTIPRTVGPNFYTVQVSDDQRLVKGLSVKFHITGRWLPDLPGVPEGGFTPPPW